MSEITMPNLGMSMLVGKVAKWMVEDGAVVEEGQEVVEVINDTGKLNKVLEAPQSGKLSIRLPEDETIETGGVIAVIE